MYEELIKKMRQQCADMSCGNCNTCLNGKAADAIEELQAQNNELLFRCGQAEALIDYYQSSLAGTAACQRCLNNPSATEPTTKLTTYTTTILPYSNLYKNLMGESEPKPETDYIRYVERHIVKCKDCEFYIKHDKRCVVWNHGVSKDDYCSRGQKKEVEE